VQPLENPEDGLVILGIDANPVIANREYVFAIACRARDMNPRRRIPAVLNPVRHKILKELRQV